MTFEEWVEDRIFYWNELDRGDLEVAFNAGYDAGYEKGDYLEGWDEGYKQAKKEFAEKRGYPW